MSVVLAVLAAQAWAQTTVAPPADFFEGEYVAVGREPNEGATYSGTVEIRAIGADTVRITRRIGDEVIAETGRMEVPSPPDAGQVLRLYGVEGTETGTCLWQIDLDNYARFTCLRGDTASAGMPGFEALFPIH